MGGYINKKGLVTSNSRAVSQCCLHERRIEIRDLPGSFSSQVEPACKDALACRRLQTSADSTLELQERVECWMRVCSWLHGWTTQCHSEPLGCRPFSTGQRDQLDPGLPRYTLHDANISDVICAEYDVCRWFSVLGDRFHHERRHSHPW